MTGTVVEQSAAAEAVAASVSGCLRQGGKVE